MGFLAPLYIAGLLAIGLPILFHLMRRSPKGKQLFSSLMFLQQSPPRLTKRSRLDNILLLILRACAFLLLCFAFARPFFSFGSNLDTYKSTGHRTALLIDTSASMQRADLFQQAKSSVEAALKNLQLTDEIALYAFDSTLHPVLTFDQWNATPVQERLPTLKAKLDSLTPTWLPTRLGEALASVADITAESVPGPTGANAAQPAAPPTEKLRREVVLVSDLQQGSHAEALQGHQWPANVLLSTRPVALKGQSNASLQWVTQSEADTDDTAAPSSAGKLRVRITNEPDSTREQFTLVWANAQGPVKNTQPQKIYCPAGHNQIVRIAWPVVPDNQMPDRLILAGDDANFDNTLYLVPPRGEELRIVYLGNDSPDDVKGSLFYLASALADTPQRHIEYIQRTADHPLQDPDLLDTRLVVITAPPAAASLPKLKRFAENGGTILWLIADAASGQAAITFLNQPGTPIAVTEALQTRTGENYSLIARVDTTHPLFAPFADARFGDFTKIHFWKHRKLKLPADLPSDLKILAWFDNNDPFLLEHPIGKGTLRIAAATWTPADSQLALSTKFVPLLEGLITRPNLMAGGTQYVLGGPISLLMSTDQPNPTTQPATTAPATNAALATAQLPVTTRPANAIASPSDAQPSRSLLAPDGHEIALTSTATSFESADKPGIYTLLTGNQRIPLAVNVPPDESRTAPLPPEDLERFGAKLAETSGKTADQTATEAATRERRLHLAELENRQKAWRWLILGVLLLLAAETALAARLTHRPPTPEATNPEGSS